MDGLDGLFQKRVDHTAARDGGTRSGGVGGDEEGSVWRFST